MPLCIDLFCGLGGWAEGFLAEGWDVVGFDIERHRYPHIQPIDRSYKIGGSAKVDGIGWTGFAKTELSWRNRSDAAQFDSSGEWDEYPAQLVLQDVLTLHGAQFRHAGCIVASPPCQAYSYRAMPWKRAKELPPPSNELFNACFRIQREASEAAGRYVPMVVENVCGAQRWVGRARWHYGSYYLWGDVPALMPDTLPVQKFNPDGTNHGTGSWFAISNSKERGSSQKVPGFRFDGSGRSFQSASVKSVIAGNGKSYGGGHGWDGSAMRTGNSHSPARKAASAQIAKIPFELAAYIARVYRP